MRFSQKEIKSVFYSVGLTLAGLTSTHFVIEPMIVAAKENAREIGIQQRSIVTEFGVDPDALIEAGQTLGISSTAIDGQVPFVDGVYSRVLPSACQNPFRETVIERACETARIATRFQAAAAATNLPELLSNENHLAQNLSVQGISALGLSLMSLYILRSPLGKATQEMRRAYANLIL